MKKLAVLFTIMLLSIASFAQLIGFRPVYITPDTATKFRSQVKSGDLVYVSSTHTMYELAIPVGPAVNMNYVLASSARYNYPSATVTGATSIFGALTVSGASTLATASVTTTLTLPGTTTITKTTGNANSATLSHSLVVTDSLTASKAIVLPGSTIITRKNANGVTASHSITATDTVFATTASVGKVTVASDTAVGDPIYTIAVKGAHVYVKIATTGATSARWKQIDN